MAFKPFCKACQTWHTEEEGHVGGSLVPATEFHADPHYKPKMTVDDKLDALMQKLIEIDIHVAELRSTLVSTFHDEFSPERKAASDRLGQTLLIRMRGEFQAREMTAPTGNYWCNACNQPHPKGFICK